MAIDRDTTLDWMTRFAGEMGEHRQELVRLDTAIGDGDHGTNMNRGMQKAIEKLDAAEQADPGAVLKTVAMALVSSVGGAAGPLYGSFFMAAGDALSRSKRLPEDLADVFGSGVNAVSARGRSQPGEKTMLDVLCPVLEVLKTEAG
ncbi:MAG TPA: dihydroxyacetone kinase subunit DhaL, partial [Acidimicrobiales bacterium]